MDLVMGQTLCCKGNFKCSKSQTLVMTAMLTVYALIGDDFRMLATRKSADGVFDGVTGPPDKIHNICVYIMLYM